MPLLKWKKNIGKNISKEVKSGKPKKQAIAIALNVAKVPKKISNVKMDKKMEKAKNHEKMETPKFKKVEKEKVNYSLGKVWNGGYEIKKNGKPTWEYTIDKTHAKEWLKNKNKAKKS